MNRNAYLAIGRSDAYDRIEHESAQDELRRIDEAIDRQIEQDEYEAEFGK